MGFLLTLLVLTACVAVHEYGHFVMMRRNGVKVLEFAIGFGPAVWQTRLCSGTVFSLRVLPLGGYVRPSAEEGERVEDQSLWAQAKILLAGMFMNATAAFVVALGIQYALGGVFTAAAPYVQWAPAWARIPLAAFAASYGIWLATPPIVAWLIVSKGLAFFEGTAGPIGIFSMGNAFVEQAPTIGDIVVGQLVFFVIINGALAGFNLLPLPPLDGGLLCVSVLQRLGVPARWLGVYRVAATMAFILLVVGVIASDVLKLFRPG